MTTAEVHDLSVIEQLLVDGGASPNDYVLDPFLGTEMTLMAWATYFGFNLTDCQAILTLCSQTGADPSLKQKQGLFQGQTAKDIALYFGRQKLVDQLEAMEQRGKRTTATAAIPGSSRTPSPPLPGTGASSFQVVRTGQDMSPQEFAENELEMLSYLAMCHIPVEDQSALCTALMNTRLCTLGQLKQAKFEELVAMELGEVYAKQICTNQYLIPSDDDGAGGKRGSLQRNRRRSSARAVSFSSQLPDGPNGDAAAAAAEDAEEDAKHAVAMLTKYILSRGGNVRGCREKRDYEERAMELDAQSELRTRYKLDDSLKQAHKGSQMQDTGVKAILTLTLLEGNERALFRYPGLVPVLYLAAKEGESTRIKYLALKAIFNLTIDKRNLKEMFEFQDLVNMLISHTQDEQATVQIQATALDTLANICNSPHTQRDMYQCDGLVDMLTDIIQQADSDDVMREAALDCLNNLAMHSQNQVDMVLHFGMIELLVDLAKLSTSTNLKETALSCLHNLAFAKENQRALWEHASGSVADCLLANCKKSSAQSLEVKQAALGTLGNLAMLEDNRVAMFAHTGLLPAVCQACGEQEHAVLAYRVLFLLSQSPALRRPLLQHFQVSGLLLKAKSSTSSSQSKNVTLFAVLSLANLRGSMDDAADTGATASQQFWTEADFKLVVAALKRSMRRAKTTGWELSDVLACLEQLCAVPAHRRTLYASQRDFLNVFVRAVADCSKSSTTDQQQSVAAAAINCLIHFTFDDAESMEWTRLNQDSIKQAMDGALEGKPTWTDAKYSADALLFRLAGGAAAAAATSPVTNKVTVCYHGKNVSSARSLANQIKASGFEVWLDEQPAGNFFDALLLTSRTSRCVLLIASKAFKESATSRVEFYAVSCSGQRRIVPVLVDKDYEDGFMKDGWLGQALSQNASTQAYYPVFQDFTSTVNQLVERELAAAEQQQHQLQSYQSAPPPTHAAMLGSVGGSSRSNMNFGSSPLLGRPQSGAFVAMSPRNVSASTRTLAQFSSSTGMRIPDSAEEIRAWLHPIPDGDDIAHKLISEGLVYSEDLAALARESSSEVKRLVPSLNSAQILRLKEQLSVLFPDTIRNSYVG